MYPQIDHLEIEKLHVISTNQIDQIFMNIFIGTHLVHPLQNKNNGMYIKRVSFFCV